nr:C-GCAxxG-C-C family protein [Candidatus Njordarchaeum guaymaensis]
MDDVRYNDILTRSFARMHMYTCAEASLQGLLEFWDMPRIKGSWATAGYMGAIQSGNTTCGLLIGSSVAIGLKVGHGQETIPEENDKIRKKAVQEVNKLYKAFLQEFGCTECKKMSRHDFSNPESALRYIQTKAWKTTCDKGLKFIFDYVKSRTEEGKI